jgi:hypothetical protein
MSSKPERSAWRSKLMAVLVVVSLGLAANVLIVEGVDVNVEASKTFDFKNARTWGWNPAGPGEVKMARTPDDDPEAMRQRAEPVILDAVSTGLADRGLQKAAAEPDLFVTYYLLLTTNTSAQTMGQFLPATAEWGLPPFAAATQSFKIVNQGSLVIDLSAKKTVVWRGVAQAKLKLDADPRKRESLLRESVHDLLQRYPPR